MERLVLKRLFFQCLAVCLHSEQKHRVHNPDTDPSCSETPGEAKDLCPSALSGPLTSIECNPASAADAGSGGHGRQSCHHPLAVRLTHREVTSRDEIVVYVGGVI